MKNMRKQLYNLINSLTSTQCVYHSDAPIRILVWEKVESKVLIFERQISGQVSACIDDELRK